MYSERWTRDDQGAHRRALAASRQARQDGLPVPSSRAAESSPLPHAHTRQRRCQRRPFGPLTESVIAVGSAQPGHGVAAPPSRGRVVRELEYGPGTVGRRIGTGELEPDVACGEAGGVLEKRAEVRLGSGMELVDGVLP